MNNSTPWPNDGGPAPGVDAQDKELWVGDDVEFDTCQLGPFTLPGIAEVKVQIGRKLDVKSPPGSDGANVTDKGYEPAKVTIKLTMWLMEHKHQLEEVIKLIHPRKKGSKRDAVDIKNAATSLLGIKSVYIQEISGYGPGKILGTKEIEFKCVEWTKAPKTNVTKTPKKAVTIANTSGGEQFTKDFNPNGKTMQNNTLAQASSVMFKP